MAGIMEITLERDGHDQPWGFRLQGGHDVGMPLSIQRVLVGTPADGILKKGDVLLKISQTDARGLSHQQAADLFTNTGNQIFIQCKRDGAVSQSANAPLSKSPSQRVPVAGRVALPEMTTKSPGRSPDTLLSNLPKSRGGDNSYSSTNQHSAPSPLFLTIQNQPYRTSPLIQPSAKIDVGPGSAVHLKRQAEYLSRTKEPLINMDPRLSDISMKQKVYNPSNKWTSQASLPEHGWQRNKVAGTLQQIQQTGSKSPVPMASSQAPLKQYYNNPMGLYSTENVAEVTRMNKMGMSGISNSPAGVIHPNKVQQVVLTPPKDYNPKDSATWQALQESDPTLVDPEKLSNFTSLKEHEPIYSDIYTPQHRKSTSPQPPPANAVPGEAHNAHLNPADVIARSRSPARSPVADLLPDSFGGRMERSKLVSTPEPEQSAVVLAALADSKPVDLHSKLLDRTNIPLFETNSIGGRKKIAQSASFNKLMMDVLGE